MEALTKHKWTLTYIVVVVTVTLVLMLLHTFWLDF